MARIYNDNSLSIGNTPLVKLNRVNDGATIWAKIEGRNPAYSVKCRIGAAMIWDADFSDAYSGSSNLKAQILQTIIDFQHVWDKPPSCEWFHLFSRKAQWMKSGNNYL